MTLHISVSSRSCTSKVSDTEWFKYHFCGQWNSSFSVTCTQVFINSSSSDHYAIYTNPVISVNRSVSPFIDHSVGPATSKCLSAVIFPATFGVIYLVKFPNSSVQKTSSVLHFQAKRRWDSYGVSYKSQLQQSLLKLSKLWIRILLHVQSGTEMTDVFKFVLQRIYSM